MSDHLTLAPGSILPGWVAVVSGAARADWDACLDQDTNAPAGGRVYVGDTTDGWIGLAGTRDDDRVHVDLIARADPAKVGDELRRLAERHGGQAALSWDVSGGNASDWFRKALADRRIAHHGPVSFSRVLGMAAWLIVQRPAHQKYLPVAVTAETLSGALAIAADAPKSTPAAETATWNRPGGIASATAQAARWLAENASRLPGGTVVEIRQGDADGEGSLVMTWHPRAEDETPEVGFHAIVARLTEGFDRGLYDRVDTTDLGVACSCECTCGSPRPEAGEALRFSMVEWNPEPWVQLVAYSQESGS